jgi:hypothetical protein
MSQYRPFPKFKSSPALQAALYYARKNRLARIAAAGGGGPPVTGTSPSIENVLSGLYNGSGASPSSSIITLNGTDPEGAGITTNGPNRLVCIVCITTRENTSEDTNEVTAIAAAGLTFTRVFHDPSFVYNDPIGGTDFPIASFSIDVFTAPAVSALTNLSWTSTMAGDGFVNRGEVYQFAISDLASLTAPFDAGAAYPLTAMETTDTTSAPTISLTTSNSFDLLLTLALSHRPVGYATAEGTEGWTVTANSPLETIGSVGSSFTSLLQFQQVSTTQSGLSVVSGWTDNYWYMLGLAFKGSQS